MVLRKQLPTSPVVKCAWRGMCKFETLSADCKQVPPSAEAGNPTRWVLVKGLWFKWTQGGRHSTATTHSTKAKHKGKQLKVLLLAGNELLCKQLHPLLCNKPLHTHTHIFEALIRHNSDVLLSSSPYLSSFREVHSQSGWCEWQAMLLFHRQ